MSEPKENKAESRRILSIAGSIQSILEKRRRSDEYTGLSIADTLSIAAYADVLSALVLHADTEIKVLE